MRLIACLYLPNWPVQRLRLVQPELKGQPIVLYEEKQGKRRVVFFSQQAACCGICAGMPVAEAASLIGAQNLHVFPLDEPADYHHLIRLAYVCHQFTPLVRVEVNNGKHCVLMDVSGTLHLFGKETDFVLAVRRIILQHVLTARLALAPNALLAWALACFALPAEESLPFKALLATTEKLPQLLARLPLEAIRLSRQTIELLHQLGIRTVGQLMGISRKELVARFGRDVLACLDQLSKFEDEPFSSLRDQEPLRQEYYLETPVTDAQSLCTVIETLLQPLIDRLQALNHGVIELVCYLQCGSSHRLEIKTAVFKPTVSSKQLLDLISVQLERTKPPAPITGVAVEITATAPLEENQMNLLEAERNRLRREQFEIVVNRLINRLGPKALLAVELLPDHRPENAFRYLPLLNANAQSKRHRPLHAFCKTRATRPLRLVDPPQPIEALILGPDGPPVRFRWNGRCYRVLRFWGPERIETGWWQVKIRRDYYQVETGEGFRFWIFQHLDNSRWFLHGSFD